MLPRWYGVLWLDGQTIWLYLLPNNSIFVTSDHRVLSKYQSSLSNISLASCLRAQMCFFIRRGFFLVRRLRSPFLWVVLVSRETLTPMDAISSSNSFLDVLEHLEHLFSLAIAREIIFLRAHILGLFVTASCSFHFFTINCTKFTETLNCIEIFLISSHTPSQSCFGVEESSVLSPLAQCWFGGLLTRCLVVTEWLLVALASPRKFNYSSAICL